MCETQKKRITSLKNLLLLLFPLMDSNQMIFYRKKIDLDMKTIPIGVLGKEVSKLVGLSLNAISKIKKNLLVES